MDQTALFTLTYGVFILGAENNGALNACIINTCQQVASDTPKLSISVLKTNLTHYMVEASSKFSISVLGEHATLEQIGHFGFKSGRDGSKFEGISYEKDCLGTPIIKEGAIATLSCKVINSIDLGSHTLFIGEVVSAEKLQAIPPMTYAFYRDLKVGKIKGGAALKVEENAAKHYECSVCHYLYDGDRPFEELEESYVCPVCKQPKSVFHPI